MRTTYFFLLAMSFCWSSIYAQAPKLYLLKDFGGSPLSSNTELYHFAKLNGKYYFSCFEHCIGLQTTDGTTNGTHPVNNLISLLYDRDSSFPIIGDKLFFLGDRNPDSPDLWVLDGATEESTFLTHIEGLDDPDPTAAKDLLYYKMATDSSLAICVSDGTPAGTQVLKRFVRVSQSSDTGLRILATLENRLYFANYKAYADAELWTTDGTVNGTVMLKEFNTGSGVALSGFGELNGRYYFSYADGSGVYGVDLYMTDNTAGGTFKLADISGKFAYPWYIKFNNQLVYTRYFPDEHTELYRTDGTVAGNKSIQSSSGLSAQDFSEMNGWLYFLGDSRLRRLDSTLQNVDLVDDLPYQVESTGSPLFTFKNHIYFLATDNTTNERGLWYSSGEPGSTKAFKSPGQTDYYRDAFQLFPFKDNFYFWADRYANGSWGGKALYRTDGTPANTQIIGPPLYLHGSSKFVPAGNSFYVTAVDNFIPPNNEYAYLWLLDSTSNAAYRIVPDSVAFEFIGNSSPLLPLDDGLLIHNRFEDAIGRELYVIHNNGTDNTGYLPGTDLPDIRIYPNPSTGLVNFDLGTEGQVRSIVLHYITGEFISMDRFDATQTNFDIEFPVQGVYVVTILFKNGNVVNRRIVIV